MKEKILKQTPLKSNKQTIQNQTRQRNQNHQRKSLLKLAKRSSNIESK